MKVSVKEREASVNEELKRRGSNLTAVYHQAVKNNTVMEGFILQKNKRKEGYEVHPIVYADSQWEQMDDQELSEYLLEIDASCEGKVENPALYVSSDYVTENLYLSVVSEENRQAFEASGFVCYPFLDMLVTLWVNGAKWPGEGGAHALIRMTHPLLKSIGMSPEEAYRCALRNTERETQMQFLEAIFQEAKENGELSEEFEIQSSEQSTQLLMISNLERREGAGAILSERNLKKIREIMQCERIAILPSSIHECLAVRYDSPDDFPLLKEMVETVNRETVDEQERLTDSVYYLVSENGTERLKKAI